MDKILLVLLLFIGRPGQSRLESQSGNVNDPVPSNRTWETVIDSSSFNNYSAFEKHWNYLYPWGTDHNGSARMYASPSDHNNVKIENNQLHIRANYINTDEGKSSHPPRQTIRYHSGAVHAKHQVTISDEWPVYEVSGDFKAPTGPGTWPAFWLTAVKGWPPETDILEFKGNTINWMNTFITPKNVTTTKLNMPDAATKWHNYKAVLEKSDSIHIKLSYYIDGQLQATHTGNFMNKAMWIIINLQMEGSAEGSGPTTDTDYFIKNILVKRSKQL